MRRALVVFLLINLTILLFLVRSVFTLLTLLFEDASGDAILHSELSTLDSSLPNTRPQLIPKIIHQTYKNSSIPFHWREPQRSCIDLHPDYEYKLWTDSTARNFIRTQYPWFIDTFDGYQYPIQRADTIRYFVLAHYGGVYIDLDDGCNRRLDPLLSYTAWVRRTKPTGVSNDAMGAVPHHPFFLRVIERLQSYDRRWVLPYITIMYSTGPLFLSVIWKEWMGENSEKTGDWEGRVRVLMNAEYNQHPWSFFKYYRGSSWHGSDAALILWTGKYWMLLTAVGVMLAGAVAMAFWWVYGTILLLWPYRGFGLAGPTNSRNSSSSPVSRLPFWNRFGAIKQQYELVEQRDP